MGTDFAQVQCLSCGTLRAPDPPSAAVTPCAKCHHYGWVYPPGDFPVPLDRGGVWGQIDRLNVLPFTGGGHG